MELKVVGYILREGEGGGEKSREGRYSWRRKHVVFKMDSFHAITPSINLSFHFSHLPFGIFYIWKKAKCSLVLA